MNDKKPNEQKDELRDLDVRVEQAEGVKGGLSGQHLAEVVIEVKAKPKDPGSGGSP